VWVVVGLGNPGRRYVRTRHNVGFLLVDRLAERWAVKLKKKSYPAKAGMANREQGTVHIVKPWTFMNQSGKAVRAVIRKTGVKPGNLLLVYDDLDIPLGEIRIRTAGGPGTHKGMLSVVQEIGTEQFPRLRIGIGPLPPGRQATQFVLSRFGKQEAPLLESGLSRAMEALFLVLEGRIQEAMTRFNRKQKAAGEAAGVPG